MHTPDQLPDGQQPSIHSLSDDTHIIAEQAETPEQSEKEPPAGQNPADQQKREQPINEAIREGAIYPPPPSFYQQPPVETTTPRISYGGWTDMPNYPRPQPEESRGSPNRFVPPQPNPFPPVAYPGRQQPGMQASPLQPGPYQKKQSKKWLWILITTLIIVLVGSCGLCTWAGYSLIGNTYNQILSIVVDGQNQVNSYYSDLINKQYAEAYQVIDPQGSIQGLSESQFIQKAEQEDNKYGPVYSYTLQQPQINTDGETPITQFVQKVDIVRGKRKYTATLTLQKIHNVWKITSYDQL